jgi:uncharacterized protein (TIGR02217 family)
MGFHEVRFPTDISYGSRGGPGFNTNVVILDSGSEKRFSRWETERNEYDVGYGIRSLDNIYEVMEFFRSRRGSAYGFRYKDWLDFTSASNGSDTPTDTDQEIGTGDGTEDEFQLIKTYDSGPASNDYVRNIVKPVVDTVSIAFDGTPQPTGWSVSTATGVVLFTSPPSAAVVITAGYEFDVPVRFGEDADKGLQASIDAFKTGTISNIPIVELKDELPLQDNFPYRGGKVFYGFTGDLAITMTDGFSIHFSTTVVNLDIYLPDETYIPTGGIHFQLFNDGPQSLGLVDKNGNSVLQSGSAFSQGSSLLVSLTELSGTKEWVVL